MSFEKFELASFTYITLSQEEDCLQVVFFFSKWHEIVLLLKNKSLEKPNTTTLFEPRKIKLQPKKKKGRYTSMPLVSHVIKIQAGSHKLSNCYQGRLKSSRDRRSTVASLFRWFRSSPNSALQNLGNNFMAISLNVKIYQGFSCVLTISNLARSSFFAILAHLRFYGDRMIKQSFLNLLNSS